MTMSEPSSQCPTVLCVDDEPHIRKALSRELRRYGCRVLLASSGEEALDLLSREAVEVLICDFAMRGMCGVEVLERAREVAPGTARILLSAHCCDEDVAIPAVNKGQVFRLLLKPWEEDDLRRAVADSLGLDPEAWQRKHAQIRSRLREPGEKPQVSGGPC